jgi:hypothetical protein
VVFGSDAWNSLCTHTWVQVTCVTCMSACACACLCPHLYLFSAYVVRRPAHTSLHRLCSCVALWGACAVLCLW